MKRGASRTGSWWRGWIEITGWPGWQGGRHRMVAEGVGTERS